MPEQLRTGTMQRGRRPGARLRGVTVLVAFVAALVALTAMVTDRATAVYENSNSLTAALNKSDGKSAPPARLTTGKKLAVKWHRTAAATNSVMWRDFRVRWSADQRPPIVASDPHGTHEVFTWALQLKVDDQPALVRGNVTWTGTPAPVEKKHYPVAIALGVALFLALLLMITLSARRRRDERQKVRPEPEYSTSRFIGARN